MQPTGRDNALHGSCLTVARIDSPFRVWAVPFLFSQCHLFQKIPYQYVDVRFHRRGVFAPVYCRTINYGSDCLLGPLNVSGRDILFPSAEKISRPPCGQLVFFLSRANIPFAPDTEVVQRASKTSIVDRRIKKCRTMKTDNNISDRRGKASISSLNRIKRVARVLILIIASTIGLVLWIFIRPIFRGVGWVISIISALLIIYWILTL